MCSSSPGAFILCFSGAIGATKAEPENARRAVWILELEIKSHGTWASPGSRKALGKGRERGLYWVPSTTLPSQSVRVPTFFWWQEGVLEQEKVGNHCNSKICQLKINTTPMVLASPKYNYSSVTDPWIGLLV